MISDWAAKKLRARFICGVFWGYLSLCVRNSRILPSGGRLIIASKEICTKFFCMPYCALLRAATEMAQA